MTNSMNNLAEKANEQAASLEETAAALKRLQVLQEIILKMLLKWLLWGKL